MTKRKNFFLFFFIILILGYCLRIYNYDNLFFWGDETFTSYITDPKISFEQFVIRHKNIDDNPIIYFYLLRVFNLILGFSSENTRFFSIVFSTASIFLSYFYFKNYFKSSTLLVSLGLISFNIFLIWQAKEARIASSLVFFCLTSLILFNNYLLSPKKKKIYFLTIINFLLLCYYPFFVVIIISQYVYLKLYYNKNCNIFLILSILLSVFYLFLFKDYIFLKIQKPSHIGKLNLHFFFNYFFTTFFGSIFLGVLSLIIVFLSFYKKIFSLKNKIRFEYLIIIISYLFIILYSIFFAGIVVPRYFIFLIPCIIVIITEYLLLRKNMLFLYLFITIINSLILLDKFKIQKPELSYLNKFLDDKEVKHFFSNENEIYNHYLKNYKKLNKNLKFINQNELNDINKFYFICLNYPRMHYGLRKFDDDEHKCKIKFDKKIINIKNITDFKIILLGSK